MIITFNNIHLPLNVQLEVEKIVSTLKFEVEAGFYGLNVSRGTGRQGLSPNADSAGCSILMSLWNRKQVWVFNRISPKKKSHPQMYQNKSK